MSTELREGFESVVLDALKELGLEGRFQNSVLFVPKGDKQKAMNALKKNQKVLRIPRIVEEGMNFKSFVGDLNEEADPEHQKAVTEFEKANEAYRKQYPKGFASDHAVLKKTLTLFKNKKFKDAVNTIDRADTLVRELVPESAWKMMHDAAKVKESVEQLTEAEHLFDDFEEIKVDPDRDDVYDLVNKIMPAIIKISYTFLYHDKVKHDRTYHNEEEEDKFDFSVDALRQMTEEVIGHVKDRLDNITSAAITEDIGRLAKDFRYPLEEKAK